MEEMALYGVWLVPLIVGIVEVVKQVGKVPSNFVPLVSIGCGLGAGALIHGADWPQAIVVGLALGLSAIGLYSGTKNTIAG